MCQKLHSELLVQADDTIDRSQWRKVSVWNLFLVTEIQKDHNCVWPVSKSGFTLIPFSWMKSEVLKAVLRGSAPTCLLSGSLGSFPQWKTQWRTSATVDWGQRERQREKREKYSLLGRYYLHVFPQTLDAIMFVFTWWICELDVLQSSRSRSSDSAHSQIWE